MVERQKEIVKREAEERQRAAQGLPPRPPSTSSPQVTPATTATAIKDEGGEAAGPAPQNTATLVDAPSPAPPQVRLAHIHTPHPFSLRNFYLQEQ